MESILKRKENGAPHFTKDNRQRTIVNPFYAITVAPQLTEELEPAMSEAEWVQANAPLMREMGSERWLRPLLDVLEGKAAAPEQPINPSQAASSTRCSPPNIPHSSNGKCRSTSTLRKYATWGQRAGSGSCWMCSAVMPAEHTERNSRRACLARLPCRY
jgi:hypothetical protein